VPVAGSLAVQAAIAVVGLVLAYAVLGALRDRRTNEGVERTAERAGERVEGVTKGVLTLGRVTVVTLLAIGFQFVGELTTLLTEAGGYVAEAAVPVSNVVAIAAGYLGWTGQLSIPPQYFALGGLLLLTVAVVVRDA